MNKAAFFLLFLFLIVGSVKAQCTSTYSMATYALAHTKKSLSSDNFDHQKLYAERAIESFEKDRELVKACGCEESLAQIEKGLDNLYKAVDPKDWEEGRYYTKKALANAHELISTLDICTNKGAASKVDYSVATSSFSGSGASGTAIADQKNSLLEKQEQLAAEQEKLIEEQKQLNYKIEQQQQLAERNRYKRQQELEQQMNLKRIAEASLSELEKNLKAIATDLGYEQAIRSLKVDYQRSDDALNNESLEQTRQYYLKQVIKIQQQALDSYKSSAVSK